jgi:hypothetical protein
MGARSRLCRQPDPLVAAAADRPGSPARSSSRQPTVPSFVGATAGDDLGELLEDGYGVVEERRI